MSPTMSSRLTDRWVAGLLIAGALLTVAGVKPQRDMQLVQPLDHAVPTTLAGYGSVDLPVTEEEQAVAGMDSFVSRAHVYADSSGVERVAFTIYTGFYSSQSQGHTIHSPQNCLPGSGWEPVSATRTRIPSSIGPLEVNRYVLANGSARSLVIYWYQGRGRTESSEYAVKWHLLRDQALLGRSEEALARVVVPMRGDEEAAWQVASTAAAELAAALHAALPPR